MNIAEDKNNLRFSHYQNSENAWNDPDSNDALSAMIQKRKMCYFNIVKHFNEIASYLKKNESYSADILKNDIDDLISLFRDDDRIFLSLANAPYSFISNKFNAEIYGIVVINGINTMIYSLKIALALGISELRLPYICFSAIFRSIHLLAMNEEELLKTSFDDSFVKKLSSIKNTQNQFLENVKINALDKNIILKLVECAATIHSGMPAPDIDPNISQYAFIIFLCNEFEKLSNLHAGEKKLAPVEAMKKLRDDMIGHFNSDIIKIFFNNLSIYPVGTYVKLSSGEIAKIVKLNFNSLLRPVVAIVANEAGIKKLNPVKINLREKPNLYIKKPIVDKNLTEEYIDLL